MGMSRTRPGRREVGVAAVLLASIVATLGGCRSTPQAPLPPRFYPSPPARPRIQFLRSLASSADVMARPSAFGRFVFGASRSAEVDVLTRPYGMAMAGGRLYVCDSGTASGAVLDLKRRQFRRFGHKGEPRLRLPVNVALGPGGERYVTDVSQGHILVFGANDKLARRLTGPGVDRFRPCGIAFSEGELFVTDLKSNAVLVLDPRSGRVLRRFGRSGSKPGEFFQPTNLAFGPDGGLYVSDTLNARVQQFDRSGAFVRAIGKLDRRLGGMIRPKGIALDRAGRLYVADAATDSVQIFNADGDLLMRLGGPGAGRGDMSLPAQILISYEGIEHFADHISSDFRVEYLIFVSSHLGHGKINVYGFGTYLGDEASGPNAPPAEGAAPRER